MSDAKIETKAEYKVELDAVFTAKLQVLVETEKLKNPHAPVSGSDIVNKALAIGLNNMLAITLRDTPVHMVPTPWPANGYARVGDVGTFMGD